MYYVDGQNHININGGSMKKFIITNDGDFFYTSLNQGKVLPINSKKHVMFEGINIFFDMYSVIQYMDFYLNDVQGLVVED